MVYEPTRPEIYAENERLDRQEAAEAELARIRRIEQLKAEARAEAEQKAERHRQRVNRHLAEQQRQPHVSATKRWNEAIALAKQTMPPAKAVRAVNRQHPGLREKMIAEVNQ